MESYAESVGVIKKFDARNSSHSLSANISTKQFLDKLLFFIKALVEYAFGMHIGFAIGWLIGLYTGTVYVEHFRPMYLDNLNQLSHWRLMPYAFAGKGALVGVALGILAIAIINSKLFSRRVISLYEKEITDPKDIAQTLGKSVAQTERKINRLMKKGNLRHKTNTDTNNKTLI